MIPSATNSKLSQPSKHSNEKETSKSKYYVKRTFCFLILPFTFLFGSFRFILTELFYLFRGLCTSVNQSVKTSKSSLNIIDDVQEYQTSEKEMNAENPFAVQRHHHRRAFDFISKALKIDEENNGNYFYCERFKRSCLDKICNKCNFS